MYIENGGYNKNNKVSVSEEIWNTDWLFCLTMSRSL